MAIGKRVLDNEADETSRRIPAIIENASEGFSQTVLSGLKKKWSGERRLQRRDMDGFRKRLEQRWGTGLESLRLLVTIAREFGDDFNKDGRAASGRSHPQAFDVLTRLHARACQIAEEVICLLSNGFADGAMARWRTMHEIEGVCYLLGEHGDNLAGRYVAHQIVEARGAAIQYRKHEARLRQEPLSDTEFNKIENDYKAALQTYGETFAGQYGWAAKHVGKKRPTVTDIQEAANIDHFSLTTKWPATTFTPILKACSSNWDLSANPRCCSRDRATRASPIQAMRWRCP